MGTSRKYAFKVFDLACDNPYFLFHGLRGSRRVPVGEWLQAENKDATDGSNTTIYKSGFHVFPTKADIVYWANWVRHRKNRVVVRVMIEETWPKTHGRGNVLLAQRMKITHEAWKQRQPL